MIVLTTMQPFDASTPFVEKEGYAWCVGCHTNRYSSKCKRCRKPITDIVVNALGADWHGDCFCCTVRCSPGAYGFHKTELTCDRNAMDNSKMGGTS